MTPKVSVIMPVHNGTRYLKESIDSILGQSYRDLEFIIIDDASTDDSAGIIASYSDQRIIQLHNDSNLGVAASLNKGVALARGEYVARMDADDISLPDRLALQVEYLDANPQISILGSYIRVVNEGGEGKKIGTVPTWHEEIKWRTILSSAVTHPTVMGRSAIFKENPYDPTLKKSQDYELWSRLIFEKGIKFANLSRCLLIFREHAKSATRTATADGLLKRSKISLANLKRYIDLSPTEENSFIKIRTGGRLKFSEVLSLFSVYDRLFLKFEISESLAADQSALIQKNLKQMKYNLLLNNLKAAVLSVTKRL